MFAWLRRFFPRETPHRWLCSECGKAWDIATRHEPRDVEGPNEGPLDRKKHPAHAREEVRLVSDGFRAVVVRCGPVRYEGRFVHPLDPRAVAAARSRTT